MSSLLLFDGGIGTELYERGFYINRPFEELNLSNAADVVAVHRAYVDAGAEVLTTNTFAASRPQLKNFDLEERLSDVIHGALAHANAARAGEDGVRIAFSMGPLGELVEPLGSFGLDETREEFARVARIARDAASADPKLAYDFYIFETFTNLSELEAGIDGVRSVDPATPIIASMSVKSPQSELIQKLAESIGRRKDVQYLGLNCSEGPSDLYASLKKLILHTKKPVIVQPNAGTPRHVNGRYFYMTSPDYMAKYAKRFIELGALGVGGCCGTNPDHIRAIRSAVRMLEAQAGGRPTEEDASELEESRNARSIPAEYPRTDVTKRIGSRIGELLLERAKNPKRKIVSIEMIPPKGTEIDRFLAGARKIAAAGVDFINIPDGARAMTRVGSLHLAAYVQRALVAESGGKRCPRVIPHFTTRDRNLIALQSDLLGAYVNGVNDLLIVTGDPPKLGSNREATAVYDIDSIGLTYLADCLNRGFSPNEEILGRGTTFGIGVAANPTAVNLELEQKRWNWKIESGADFAVTQPIFDAESFLRWRDLLGDQYRPHLVGIWPLVSLRNAEFMANEVPGVHVPDWVVEEMEKAGDNSAEAIKRGVEIAMRTMREIGDACEGFCVSAPLGKVDVAIEALRDILPAGAEAARA